MILNLVLVNSISLLSGLLLGVSGDRGFFTKTSRGVGRLSNTCSLCIKNSFSCGFNGSGIFSANVEIDSFDKRNNVLFDSASRVTRFLKSSAAIYGALESSPSNIIGDGDPVSFYFKKKNIQCNYLLRLKNIIGFQLFSSVIIGLAKDNIELKDCLTDSDFEVKCFGVYMGGSIGFSQSIFGISNIGAFVGIKKLATFSGDVWKSENGETTSLEGSFRGGDMFRLPIFFHCVYMEWKVIPGFMFIGASYSSEDLILKYTNIPESYAIGGKLYCGELFIKVGEIS